MTCGATARRCFFLREAGFRPPVATTEAVEPSWRYAVDHPGTIGPRPDYAVREAAAERYAAWLGGLRPSNGSA